jgi:hypothetical protein
MRLRVLLGHHSSFLVMGDFNPIHLALLKGTLLSSKRKFLNSSSFWIINLCIKRPIEEAEPRHPFSRFSSQEILLDFGIHQSPCTLILHKIFISWKVQCYISLFSWWSNPARCCYVGVTIQFSFHFKKFCSSNSKQCTLTSKYMNCELWVCKF